MDSTKPWKTRAMQGARLPIPPAALSAIALLVLGWLAYQSAGALLLWRSLDNATASLEAAVEDLGTLRSAFQECFYAATASQDTASGVYRNRFESQRQQYEAASARALADLDADPPQKSALMSLVADAQPLLAALDSISSRDSVTPNANLSAFDGPRTLALRMPRDLLLQRLETLQSDVRERAYGRRAETARALHSALVKLCWSAVGTLIMAVGILLLLAWVAGKHEAAERGLASTEEQFRDLLEHSGELIAVLSADGAYLYTNPAWQFRLGTALAALPEAEANELRALTERALRGERLNNIPLRLTSAQRRTMLVQATLTRRENPSGPAAVRWICRDVTAEEIQEQRVRAQLSVAQSLGSALSSEAALPRVLSTLALEVHADFADIWFGADGDTTLQLGYIWSRNAPAQPAPASMAHSLHKGEGLPGCVLDRRHGCWQSSAEKTVSIHSIGTTPLPSMVTGLGVPISFQTRVLGVMQFYFIRPVAREDAMLETMETIGLAIGQFLGRCSREQQLETMHRQTDSLLNSVAEGIIGYDDAGHATFVNPAAAALLSQPPSAFRRADVHTLLHGVNNCAPGCPLRRVLASSEGASGQDYLHRRDGSSVAMEYSLSPRNDGRGEVGRVLTVRDITERQALDRMKDEFVSTVSHELRTPLTSIRGALGLLDSGRVGEMSDEASRLMRIAVTNTDRLIRLINDILDLERMQSGRAPLQVRNVDLAELMSQSVDVMRPLADAQGVRVELIAAPAVAAADPDRMQQVFTNLLSNAIKFSSPDTAVTVTVDAGEHNVVIAVQDEGRGIPLEKLESVFDRFQQVDATDSRQKGGTGLGLAICRTIVEQHEGRIWADRNDGAGVTFRILVPRRQPDTEAALGLFSGTGAIGETVLLCDDDATSRSLIRAYLEPHHYRVLEAGSGEEAIAMARREKPSAVLLDINLPKMSGWEVLHALKSGEDTSSIPVVIVSMLPPAPTLDRTNGWLQKPFTDSTLIAELGRLLRDKPAGDTNVLLVEDDAMLARVIGNTFAGSGITLHHAMNLAEARRLCERVPPDLLVLDLGLPDGNGMELVEWLRNRFALNRLPLVVYSGRDVTQEEQGRLYEHPSQILTKTHVSPQEIEHLVLAMLRNGSGAQPALPVPWDAHAGGF